MLYHSLSSVSRSDAELWDAIQRMPDSVAAFLTDTAATLPLCRVVPEKEREKWADFWVNKERVDADGAVGLD